MIPPGSVVYLISGLNAEVRNHPLVQHLRNGGRGLARLTPRHAS